MLNDVAHHDLSNLAINMHAKPGAFALLLGSGISQEAGIPTGWGVTLKLVEQLYKTTVEDGSATSENELLAWYQKKVGREPDYSDLVEKLGKTAAGERDLLAGFFEPLADQRDDPAHRRPTRAHQTVASLIASGMVKVVVTTNFDRLLEQALTEAGVTPDVVIMDENDIPTAIPRVHANAVIVKVHGDYKRANLRNSVERLKSYPAALKEYIADIFRDYGLVIAGWSGGYDFALRDLLTSPGAYPTYWIEPFSPHPDAGTLQNKRAATMIEATADEAFDRLQLKLEALEHDTPAPRSAREASEEVKRLLSDPKRYAVGLEDYLQELGFSLTEALRGGRYISSSWTDPSRDQEFLDVGLKLAAPAAAALATVARYDHDEHYDGLILENFEYLERYSPGMSSSSTSVKLLALRSVPFAVLCVLADQSQYARLTKLASSMIRYQSFTTSSTPLANRLAHVGLIPSERLQGAITNSFGGFAAMKEAVDLLPQGLLKRPLEALFLTEILVRLTYLHTKKGEPKFWLANYMYESSFDTIVYFLQRTDIDHDKILPDFRKVLLAYDDTVPDDFDSPFILRRGGFIKDAVVLYDKTHKQ